MRLINADELRIKPEYMHDICGVVMIRVEDVVRIINEMPTIDSQPQKGKMIDRQAAIEVASRECHEFRGIFSDIEHGLKELPSTEPQKWIPCSERLPKKEKKTYWVCTDDGYQCECRWTNVNMIWTHLTNDWHWNILDIPQHSKVTAWMPLPEPYKELYKEEEE